MKFSQIVEYVQLPAPGEKSPESQKWLECTDVLSFLVRASQEQIPIYISTDFFFLYTVLVQKNRLRGNYVDNILNWNMGVSGGWGYGSAYNQETKQLEKHIFPPLSDTGSTLLDNGEALLFLRSVYQDRDTYLELNQRLAHILGVHKIEKRSAYSRVDEETGDLVDIVPFTQENGIVCTIDRKSLTFYLQLTDTVLVQLFDVTRWHKESFSGWHDNDIQHMYTDRKNYLFAHYVRSGNKAAYLRGFHLIRPTQSEKQVLAEWFGERKAKKRYVSVIAHDFKHRKVHRCSCDPRKLGNYFVTSDLPFETSPAFFRPEVLLRYKQDTDKYEIGSGAISCRGAWWLRYNTNDAGQIQLYLIDLSHLPYSEQLYWQAFNEQPKAGISEQVFRRDFYGEWVSSPDPLEELKQVLQDFPLAHYRGQEVVLWKRPSEKQLAKLTYVVTDSPKEWEDQILELAKTLVDGFRKAEIRKIAKVLGCDDPQRGSTLLLKTCLEKKGLDAESVQIINEPLRRLYELRSTIAAHAGRTAPDEDLKQHHKKLVQGCKQSMENLAELIRGNYLDVV
jgi:hypothetical protein